MNKLYFGDCLEVMRESIGDESVDLIYLDPPFNSKRPYNLLFKTPRGHTSDAQITAFEDSWHWGEQSEREFAELLHCRNTDTAELISSFRQFLGENDMMAYLTMMANRIVEMQRVMKETGSLYLHCDSNASHYLKVLLDSILGKTNFRNEITWKRQSAHSDASTKFASITDSILYYVKSEKASFNVIRKPLDKNYVETFYRHTDKNGRRYRLDNMAAPEGGGMAAINMETGKPRGWYLWKGYEPPTKGWRYSPERMQVLHEENRLHYPDSKSKRIQLKRYLDENKGAVVSCLWDDIKSIQSASSEGLGYPTQKPLVLLERIIKASTNEGDILMDPFCGCGTAVHAAQKLNRQWIGIDITHLAISLIEKRLNDAFPNIEYEVFGTPISIAGAKDLANRDKYQFQWWACSLINAQPYKGKKKGADTGIDGLIYFQDEKGKPKKIIVSVKGGKNVHRDMIADLKNSVEREKAQMGLFVTLKPPTKPMIKEACSAGFYESPHFQDHKFPKIQILTIEGLLNETEYAKFPDLSQGAWTFKRARREDLEIAQNEPDLFIKK